MSLALFEDDVDVASELEVNDVTGRLRLAMLLFGTKNENDLCLIENGLAASLLFICMPSPIILLFVMSTGAVISLIVIFVLANDIFKYFFSLCS
jgi:hypothetical protein